MPRPGPRPYECVRRAWHSDRHQPMRGSLIQEIFRVVNEIHSPTTRKNKEWQDKLPIVVLKAEEIMYSKANSEAEYVDLKTLWDRANDAINTIIRLDESTETGVFLQPCIEAALNLGCIPRRTSRSERNNSSTYYLNTNNNTEPNRCPLNNLPKTAQETPIRPFVAPYPAFVKPNGINLPPFSPPSIDKSLKNKFPFPSPLHDKRHLCLRTKPPSIYPLYYGNDIPLKDPKTTADPRRNGKVGFVQNPCFRDPRFGFGNGESQTQSQISRSQEHECDLSLRLGPTVPIPSLGKRGFEPERLGFEATVRKRTAAIGGSLEDLRFSWGSSSGGNGGGERMMRNAGL